MESEKRRWARFPSGEPLRLQANEKSRSPSSGVMDLFPLSVCASFPLLAVCQSRNHVLFGDNAKVRPGGCEKYYEDYLMGIAGAGGAGWKFFGNFPQAQGNCRRAEDPLRRLGGSAGEPGSQETPVHPFGTWAYEDSNR